MLKKKKRKGKVKNRRTNKEEPLTMIHRKMCSYMKTEAILLPSI